LKDLVTDSNLHADIVEMERLTLQMGWTMHKHQTQQLKAYNLTMPQFMILRALQRLDMGCTMSELGEAAMQVPATVTGIIDRLEEQALVSREPNPTDRRSYHIILTEAGKALLQAIDAQRQQNISSVFQDIPEEQRKLLLTFLQQYMSAMLAEDY
jgi:DNA-binding MarR family transcriptional regulator